MQKNVRAPDDCFHYIVLRAIIAGGVVIIAMIARVHISQEEVWRFLLFVDFPDTEFNVVWVQAWGKQT